MISSLARARGARARWLRHHGAGLSGFPETERARRAHPRRARRRSMSRMSTKLAATGAQIRAVDSVHALPAALEKAVRRRFDAHERRQGDRRSRCAPPPRRKTCRKPPSPDSKRHSSTCAARRPCSRRCTKCSHRCSTIVPSPIACITASITTPSPCRPACSTWCAAISARAASCSRSTPTRAFGMWCSSRRPTASAKPSCRAR